MGDGRAIERFCHASSLLPGIRAAEPAEDPETACVRKDFRKFSGCVMTKLTYDEAQNLSANGFTRGENYTFLGWSTDPAATAATYNDSQSVSNLTATNGATVNMYAQWTLGQVTTHVALKTPEPEPEFRNFFNGAPLEEPSYDRPFAVMINNISVAICGCT